MNSMMRESWQQYRFFDAGFRMANPCEFSLNMFCRTIHCYGICQNCQQES